MNGKFLKAVGDFFAGNHQKFACLVQFGLDLGQRFEPNLFFSLVLFALDPSLPKSIETLFDRPFAGFILFGINPTNGVGDGIVFREG